MPQREKDPPQVLDGLKLRHLRRSRRTDKKSVVRVDSGTLSDRQGS